ncbi:MAG: PEGA domain-containing protein, partial [Polyangiales bacterium]
VLVASIALAMKKPADQEASAKAAAKTIEAPKEEPKKVAPPPPTVAAPAPSVAVKIDSEPTGAKVQDDQHAVLCDKTPCTVQVGETPRILIVTFDGYDEQKVRIERSSTERKIALTKKAAPQVIRTNTTKTETKPTVNPDGFKDVPY